MATLVAKTVDPDGTGDYTSLTSWQSTEAGDISVSTGSDEYHVVTCISTGATADTSRFNLSGWTTEAPDNTITIQAGADHNGVWSTDVYEYDVSWSSSAMEINTNETTLIGLQINQKHPNGHGIDLGSSITVTMEKCIVKTDSSGNGDGILTFGTSPDFRISNCLVYDFVGGNGFNISNTYGTEGTWVYNCTAYNCDYGFNSAGTQAVAKNCLSQSNVTGGFTGTWSSNSTDNCSDNNDAPGSNPENATATFADAASDDFTLSSSDTAAKDKGADLSSDSDLPVTEDVAGTARPQNSTFDIGFFEVVAAAAGTRRVMVIS